MKISKPHLIEKLVELVESYRNRQFDEDITMLRDSFGSEQGIAQKLNANLKDGLLWDDFLLRDANFGTNKKTPPQQTGFWALFTMALDDLMLKILIVCAIVSMTISMIFEKEHREIAWIEGAAILLAVFIVSSVTAWNDFKKEEQFIKLKYLLSAQLSN